MHEALLQLETQVADLRSRYAPDDPQIQALGQTGEVAPSLSIKVRHRP